ncbi:MAG: DUF1800 domain-containing protein [Dokdonella sp.]
MAAASASTAFVASRRRLFSALFSSAGIEDVDSGLSLRRPGRDGFREKDLPQSPDALSFPPAPVRWLTRCTFGYSIQEEVDFNALPGGTDDTRWTSWINRQLNPAGINDSACDARVSGAGFVTLNKSPNQLWNDHHAVTNDYSLRMKPIAETECMTVIRQTYSKRQLFEVMVDFWHDHFSVFGWDYDGGPMFPAFDRLAIRPYVFGNFRTMLQEVGMSASMMYMLDLYSSEAAHPNENYARELFELHTMGAENYGGIVQDPDSAENLVLLGNWTAPDGKKERLKYVDDDVYETARALTGWTISGANWPYGTVNGVPLGGFAYNATVHDQGIKRILARNFQASQGQADGVKLFDMLARHPRTARHVAAKICRRFVGSNPSTALIDSAAATFSQAWQASDQIAQVLQVILQSSEFKSGWGTGMKRPALSAVSALRGTGADFTPKPDYNNTIYTPTEEFMGRLQAAGHKLFYWPAPNGYPDDPIAWSSTGALGMTLKMLPRLLEMHQTESYNNAYAFLIDVQSQTLGAFAANLRTSANIIGYWCDRILGYRPEPIYTVALDFLRQNVAATVALDLTTDGTDNGHPSHTGTWNLSNLSKHYTIARLRTAIGLILCSPEFLRR